MLQPTSDNALVEPSQAMELRFHFHETVFQTVTCVPCVYRVFTVAQEVASVLCDSHRAQACTSLAPMAGQTPVASNNAEAGPPGFDISKSLSSAVCCIN